MRLNQIFKSVENSKIVCCVDYFPEEVYGQCHIYSSPYTLIYYKNITNSFPGRLFNTAQEITLFDERPFQHDFFIKISQSFPFLNDLTVTNSEPQKADNDNRIFSTFEYSHLTKLNLFYIHDHYVEQFLFHTKAYLPKKIHFSIDFRQLQRVTHNFTRDATRKNCSQIKTLLLDDFL